MARSALGPQFRLRLSLVDGPELRCPYCGEWWPITTEFWQINKWDLCLSCSRERSKLYAAIRRRDEEYRVEARDRSRRYRQWLKRVAPQYLPAYERERRANRREYQRQRRARQRHPEGRKTP